MKSRLDDGFAPDTMAMLELPSLSPDKGGRENANAEPSNMGRLLIFIGMILPIFSMQDYIK